MFFFNYSITYTVKSYKLVHFISLQHSKRRVREAIPANRQVPVICIDRLVCDSTMVSPFLIQEFEVPWLAFVKIIGLATAFSKVISEPKKY